MELHSFFRILNAKKWSYLVFSGSMKKKLELYGFSGSYSLKNGDTWLFRENNEKK